MNIKTHNELYQPSNWRQSLDYASTLSIPDQYPEFNIHFYWRVPRDFTRKQVLPLKSAIVNHDLSKVKIHFWSNIDLTGNEHIKELLPYIHFKIYDFKVESKDTILEDMKGITDDRLCYLGGDLFRLLMLYKYGGVYCDMDVAILRDLTPLLNTEFLYQWGSAGTNPSEPEIRANGAIMHLKANSAASNAMLRQLKKTPPNADSTCWGTCLYRHVTPICPEITIFPCVWFNTEWCLGIPLQPFKRNVDGNNSDELYNGAFTWHWHNKWDDEIEDGCKFANIESIINSKFKEL